MLITDPNPRGSDVTREPDVMMQKPGEVIAPEVADGLVEKVAKELYGLTVTKCKQLNGYDDKNYHVKVLPTSLNPHVTSQSSDGYVMKIINTMDTNRPDILFAQIEVMKHLRSHGIATQEPVPTLDGCYVGFYDFPAVSGPEGAVKRHAVCLRTFLPGQIYYTVTLTPDLCYQLGAFQASVTKALQDFSHPFYDHFDYLWSMNNIPELTDFAHVITDVRDREVVDDVIQQYTRRVLSRKDEIRSGFIHGDPNEQNILVQRTGCDEDKYVISGILDFQDVGLTHPLYDLAMLIAYASLQAETFDPLEVGGHALAGYRSVMEFPVLERSLLRVAVAGRLTQSLVLGAYNHSLDPTNQYVLTTARTGWRVLHALWDTPEDVVEELWRGIEESRDSGQ